MEASVFLVAKNRPPPETCRVLKLILAQQSDILRSIPNQRVSKNKRSHFKRALRKILQRWGNFQRTRLQMGSTNDGHLLLPRNKPGTGRVEGISLTEEKYLYIFTLLDQIKMFNVGFRTT